MVGGGIAGLALAAALDPRRWTQWCDGWAADRFAEVVLATRDRVRERAVP